MAELAMVAPAAFRRFMRRGPGDRSCEGGGARVRPRLEFGVVNLSVTTAAATATAMGTTITVTARVGMRALVTLMPCPVMLCSGTCPGDCLPPRAAYDGGA